MDAQYAEFDCIDCGTNTLTENYGYYMVRNALWEQAGMTTHGGMLCFACLEARIGRPLTIADFTDAPVNWRYREAFDRTGDWRNFDLPEKLC